MVVAAGVGTMLKAVKRPMAAMEANVRLFIRESLLEAYG
jgi:hypothetical protein